MSSNSIAPVRTWCAQRVLVSVLGGGGASTPERTARDREELGSPWLIVPRPRPCVHVPCLWFDPFEPRARRCVCGWL